MLPSRPDPPVAAADAYTGFIVGRPMGEDAPRPLGPRVIALIGIATAVASVIDSIGGRRAVGLAAARAHAWMFVLHLAVAPIALSVGSVQILRGWHERHPDLHRTLGRCYVVAAITVGLTGLWIARTVTAPVARVGFMTLGLLVAGLAAQAGWYARQGAVGMQQLLHEDAGLRSYALLYAAVFYPLISAGLRVAHMETRARDVAAWACWLPTLVVLELYRRWWRHRLRAP